MSPGALYLAGSSKYWLRAAHLRAQKRPGPVRATDWALMARRDCGRQCQIGGGDSRHSREEVYSLNRYPMPRTVSILAPKSPSFFRRPTIWTSTDRSVTG